MAGAKRSYYLSLYFGHMQKFFNNLIFRIIQDSSVSNTSHDPQFGEGGKLDILEPSWLHVHLYVLWKKLEEKVGSIAKV